MDGAASPFDCAQGTRGRGLLDARTEAALIARVREQIAREALRVRRPRSCERRVRQPVKKWPRMFTPSSITTPARYELRMIGMRKSPKRTERVGGVLLASPC